VTVAQAFHWFDRERAVAELARVIRPGGRLALIWNARDSGVAWVRDAWSVIDRVEKAAPWRNHDNWRDHAFDAMPGFAPVQVSEFRHEQLLSHDDVLRRMASVSHVAVLEPDARQRVLDEVQSILAQHPETRDQPTVAVPYRVDCIWTVRTPTA
jgi:SAM-dependent methyltransferase